MTRVDGLVVLICDSFGSVIAEYVARKLSSCRIVNVNSIWQTLHRLDVGRPLVNAESLFKSVSLQ